MQLSPILRRELLTTLRGRQAFVLLFVYSVLLAVTFCIYWPQEDNIVANRKQISRELFQKFALTQLALIILVAPAVTAPAISGEREAKTLDLLVTTSLGPGQVIRGKFLAGVVFLLLLLASSIPPLSLVFLLGGVAPAEIFLIYSMLLSSTLIFGMVGTVCSCFCRRTYNALLVAYGLNLIVPLLLQLGPLLALLALVIGLAAPLLVVSFVGVAAPFLFIYYMFGEGTGMEQGLLVLLAVCYLILTAVILAFLYKLAVWRFYRQDGGWADRVRRRIMDDDEQEQIDTPAARWRRFFGGGRLRPFKDNRSPLYEKDRRTQLLGRWPVLLTASLAMACIAGVSVLTGAHMMSLDWNAGVTLMGFTMLGLLSASLLAPMSSASAIHTERENRSVELLYTSLVTPAEVLFSKVRLCLRNVLVLGGVVILVGSGLVMLFAAKQAWQDAMPAFALGFLHFVVTTVMVVGLSMAIAAWAPTRFRALIVSYVMVFTLAASFLILGPMIESLARLAWMPLVAREWILPTLTEALAPGWYLFGLFQSQGETQLGFMNRGWLIIPLYALVTLVSLWMAKRWMEPDRHIN